MKNKSKQTKKPEKKATKTPSSEVLWAWWDAEKDKYRHLYPSELLVRMCSPDGYKTDEKEGRGRVLQVKVTPVEQVRGFSWPYETNKKAEIRKPAKTKGSTKSNAVRSGTVVTLKVTPVLAHCNGCGNDFMNVDGCPDCGTDRYLSNDAAAQ